MDKLELLGLLKDVGLKALTNGVSLDSEATSQLKEIHKHLEQLNGNLLSLNSMIKDFIGKFQESRKL